MSKNNCDVTVIMPCYNSELYLAEAIDSVLRQTLKKLELVVVDDCSADRTLEIAKKYREYDSRVSIISLTENAGPASARNAAIKVARGEWIAILDSDDVAVSTRLEEQVRVGQGDANFVMIASSSISISSAGNIIKNNHYPTSHDKLVNRLLTKRAFPPHSSMLFRRSVFDFVDGFNPRFIQSEDKDLFLRFAEAGKIISIDRPLVKIRKHSHNISCADGGLLIVRMGIVSVICHYLRINNHPDPSVDYDESQWLYFISWVNQRIEEEKFWDMCLSYDIARSNYFTANTKAKGLYRFALSLIKASNAVPLIRYKLFGSTLPNRLAFEWLSKNN